MHIKRTIAYIIDLVFITSFLLILFYFLPVSNESKKIGMEIDSIGEKYALKEIDKMTYFMELSSLEKDLSKLEAIENIINAVVIVIYYILIPYIMSGATFGKKIMNLKIVSDNDSKVSLMSLFIRTFIVDGLLACLLIPIGIYVIPKDFYLSFISILAILQVLTLIISFFMIKYKRNSLGLQDVCSHSKVIKIS